MYPSTNTIEAFGSVRIRQGDTLNLYGDYLNYNGNTQLARVSGDTVQLINKDIILTTDQLYFDRSSQEASYFTGGLIESRSDSNLLRSERGYYNTRSRIFTFKDSVVLTNPDFRMTADTLLYHSHTEIVEFLGPTFIYGEDNLIYCENGWYKTIQDQSKYYNNAYLISDGRKLEGDSMYYDRKLGYGRARGNMQITDTAQNILLNGQFGEIFELQDSAIVYDRSLLTQAFESDSLFVHADTFKVFTVNDTTKVMLAYYGVRIYKPDIQGRCDSMIYLVSDSTIKMLVEPILWSGENQLTAREIHLFIKEQSLHSIFMQEEAFIISQVDQEKYNQIKGKEMTGYLRNKKLHKVLVRGNGQTTYYGQDDEDKFIGVNVAESSDIDIYMKDSAIRSITFINKPEASMHPMGELDSVKELRYNGFLWEIEKKPASKADLFMD